MQTGCASVWCWTVFAFFKCERLWTQYLSQWNTRYGRTKSQRGCRTDEWRQSLRKLWSVFRQEMRLFLTACDFLYAGGHQEGQEAHHKSLVVCVCVCVWVYYSNECCSYPHPCSFSLPFPKVSLWPLGESVFLGCRLEGSRLFVPRLYRKMFLAPGLSSNDVGTRNYICLDLFLRRHNYAV